MHRIAMGNVIYELNRVFVTIVEDPKGDFKACLIRCGEILTVHKSREIQWAGISIHPIFTRLDSFAISSPNTLQLIRAKLSQEKTKRRGQDLSTAHTLLVSHLDAQDKRKPVVRKVATLMEIVGLDTDHKINPSRVETRLLQIIDDIRATGVVFQTFKVERGKVGRRQDAIISVTFFFEPRKVKTKQVGEPSEEKTNDSERLI